MDFLVSSGVLFAAAVCLVCELELVFSVAVTSAADLLRMSEMHHNQFFISNITTVPKIDSHF